jgi:hypothetical protein
MKSFLKFLLAITILIIAFSSCKKKNDIGRMIPANALFVAQVNMKSLDNKLPWNEIQQASWYKNAYSDTSTPEWRKKILENPSESGIDFDEGLIFFGAKDTTGYYIAAEGKLKSAKDFETFNKNFDPQQVIKKDGDINILVLKDKNIVGWNNKNFIYVMNPATTSSQMYKWDDTNRPSYNNTIEDRSAELAVLCKKLFSLKSSASLAENDHFNSSLKEPGDIHLWQNTEEIIKSGPSLGMLSMLKLDAFIKDNISTYTVDFDNGKININQKNYVSKELADVLKKYTGSSVNNEMIKNIPSQNVFAVLAFDFKPEGLKELIKLTGADGLVNTYAQQMGFNLDDISKATNGNWLLAFSDFKIGSDSVKRNDGMDDDNLLKPKIPGFNFIFSVGIGDKPSLQKLINAGTTMGAIAGKNPSVKYAMNEKLFALSNTASFADKYLGGNNNKYDFTNEFSGHPVGFFLDIHQLLSGMSSIAAKDSNANSMMNESLKTWKNIVASGGEIKDNAFTFHTEINFIDQHINSLKQLNSYLNEMYKLMEEKKQQNTARLDSLLMPPPIDTIKAK